MSLSSSLFDYLINTILVGFQSVKLMIIENIGFGGIKFLVNLLLRQRRKQKTVFWNSFRYRVWVSKLHFTWLSWSPMSMQIGSCKLIWVTPTIFFSTPNWPRLEHPNPKTLPSFFKSKVCFFAAYICLMFGSNSILVNLEKFLSSSKP